MLNIPKKIIFYKNYQRTRLFKRSLWLNVCHLNITKMIEKSIPNKWFIFYDYYYFVFLRLYEDVNFIIFR